MTGRKKYALQVSPVVPYKALGKKMHALQVPPVVPYKALGTFLRLCMGQREVLAVHAFSVLSWWQW